MRIATSPSRLVSIVLEALLMRKPSDDTGRVSGIADDDYVIDDLPPCGVKVEVIGHVGSTKQVIPFLCCWSEEGWLVAGTRRKLASSVAGWKRVGV